VRKSKVFVIRDGRAVFTSVEVGIMASALR
jgi:hypothetical protein